MQRKKLGIKKIFLSIYELIIIIKKLILMDDNFSSRVKDVITYSKEEALRLKRSKQGYSFARFRVIPLYVGNKIGGTNANGFNNPIHKLTIPRAINRPIILLNK